MKHKNNILQNYMILPNSPPNCAEEMDAEGQFPASSSNNQNQQSDEFVDCEEFAFSEDVEQSNFDPRILGDFQLGSNSSTILISNGQWV